LNDSYRQFIEADSGSSVYAVLHGDMHIRNGHPVYRVMPFPLQAAPVPSERMEEQPSRLLAAESRVVRFLGREPELAELATWRDDPAPGVSVMLIHAPGGQGKTRLAAQFAVDSAQAAWATWTAHHLGDPTAQHVVAPGDTGRALVLTVDYADRWPLDDLLLLLNNPLLRRPLRSRVLLVARAAGSWWPSLRHRLNKAGINVGPTMPLSPLGETMPERREVFVVARDAFAALFGIRGALISVPKEFEGDAFQLVLVIHMAALVAVDARRRGTIPPSDPVGMSVYLLDREHDFWHSAYDHEQVTTAPETMRRTVFSATLTRSLPGDDAMDVLDRVGIASGETAVRILTDHATCYPPIGPRADTVLEPLHPDRLGEDFVALCTPGHSIPDYSWDDWATSATEQLFSRGQGSSRKLPAYTSSAFIVLLEASRRWPHVAHRQLYPLLRAHPEIAVVAGGVAIAGLAELADVDMRILEAIEALLPEQRIADLDVGIAALTQRLTGYRLATATDPAVQATLYGRLGSRLGFAGLHQQAQAAHEEAVALFRPLATASPEEYAHHLAIALNNLGMALSELGRGDAALAATKESVDIYQRLGEASPGNLEDDLAGAFNNLGNRLSSLGRREEALAASEKAVEIRRRLAEDNPQTNLSGLAGVLGNLALRLSAVGRRADALAATREAVQIWGRLAAANPAFEPDLARTLGNLGSDLLDLGLHREDGLAITAAVLKIYRRLASTNPSAFNPDLAMALNNHGTHLSSAGHHEEALAATQEAVSIYRRLAADNPAAHEPDLAMALTHLGRDLSSLGRNEDALTVTEGAVAIRLRLAAANPAAHEPDLAWAFNNLSTMLIGVDRMEEAMGAAGEAVGMFGRLVSANSAAYLPEFGSALVNLGQARYRYLGLPELALIPTEQAVAIFRWLAAENPAAHLPRLARALDNLSRLLSEIGEHNQAIAAADKATEIRRHLVSVQPAAFEADLAKSLAGFARVRTVAGVEFAEALAAIEEAITIYGRLASQRPDIFGTNLLLALSTFADVLDRLGNPAEASEIRRTLGLSDP